ncbi:hypothetical protein Btru_063271, partial [Bulinus truncatus]
TFQLSAACSDNVRVTQFQFFSWPLNGVPDDPIPFLELRYRVRELYGNKSSPVLVICGTGVARSAVFIAVDQLIEEYGRDGCVNVYRFVKRMRRSRPFMVRNLNQYRFIYECLFEEFQAGDTVLRLDMKQQYRALCQKNPQSDFTFLMDQFRILCHFTPELTQKDCTVGSLKTNASKNVDQRMLPPDRYRPYNQVTQGDPGSWPYINAVIFNGHRRAEEFIVTQTPLINTAFEFWKMIYDYQVQTIVMFGKCRGHNQEQYFPKTGGRQFGNLYVEHVNTTSTDAVTTRNLKVCVMGPGGVEKRVIRHLKLSSTGQFQVKQWDDGDTLPVRRIDQFPNSMADVLDLMEKVLDWQVVANRRTKPMVVVCRNGATLSGLFVACAVVCERMREDREVDLYHAVKHIKRRRPAIVSDFDQYRFLHQVLWQYIVNYMPEVKKLIHFDELASSSESDVEAANGELGYQVPDAQSPDHGGQRDRGASFSKRYSPEKKQDQTWMVDDDFSDTQQLLQMHDDDAGGGERQGRELGRRVYSLNQSAASSEHSQETAESRTCTCLPVCRKKRKRTKSPSGSRTVDDEAEEDFHPRSLGSISRGLGGQTSGEMGNPHASSVDRGSDEKNFDWRSQGVKRGDSKNQVANRRSGAVYDNRDVDTPRRGLRRRYSTERKREKRRSFDDRDKFDRDIFLPPSISTPKIHVLRPRDMMGDRELVDAATGSDTVLPPKRGFARHPSGPAERSVSERFVDDEMEEMFRRLYSTTRTNQPSGMYGENESSRADVNMTSGQYAFVPRRPSSFTGRFRKAKSRPDVFDSTHQNKKSRDEGEAYRRESRDAPPRDMTRADPRNETRQTTSEYRELPRPNRARQPSIARRLFSSRDYSLEDDVFTNDNPAYARRSAPAVEGDHRGGAARDNSVVVDTPGRAYEVENEEIYGQSRQEMNSEATDHKPSTWPREVVRRFPSRRFTTPAPSVSHAENLKGASVQNRTYPTRATKESPFKPRMLASTFESIPEEEGTLSGGSVEDCRPPVRQLEEREDWTDGREPDEQPRGNARSLKFTRETAGTDNVSRRSSPVKRIRGSSSPCVDSGVMDEIRVHRSSYRADDAGAEAKPLGRGCEGNRHGADFSYPGRNEFSYEDERHEEVTSNVSKRFSTYAEPSRYEDTALKTDRSMALGRVMMNEEEGAGFQEKLWPRRDSHGESVDFGLAKLSILDIANNDGRVYRVEPKPINQSGLPSDTEVDFKITPCQSARRSSDAGRLYDTGLQMGIGARAGRSREEERVSDARQGRESQAMAVEDLDPEVDEDVPFGRTRQSGSEQDMKSKRRPGTGYNSQAHLTGQEELARQKKGYI